MALQRHTIESVHSSWQDLQACISALRSLNNSPTSSRDLVSDLLDKVDQSAHGIKSYLNDQFGVEFTAGAPTPESAAKAREVFGTPELLEIILLHLHPRYVLVAQQVSKGFDASVSTSPKLQQHLGLRADPKTHFTTPFASTYGGSSTLSVHARYGAFGYYSVAARNNILSGDKPARDKNAFEILASFNTRCGLPRLGERCRSMLICQPPVFEMEASVSCCSNRNLILAGLQMQMQIHSPRPTDQPKPIRSTTGITVGDVLDATRVILQQHRACPHAQPHEHDAEGKVDSAPSFRAMLRLEDDDPALHAQQAFVQEMQDLNTADKARAAHLQAYISAKRTGKTLHYRVSLLCRMLTAEQL